MVEPYPCCQTGGAATHTCAVTQNQGDVELESGGVGDGLLRPLQTCARCAPRPLGAACQGEGSLRAWPSCSRRGGQHSSWRLNTGAERTRPRDCHRLAVDPPRFKCRAQAPRIVCVHVYSTSSINSFIN